MKFYDRKSEIATLQSIEQASAETAQMTMMTGRRRIGKTTLLKKAFTTIPFLYFFVAKKNEVLLCEEFSQEINEKLGIPIGSYSSFSELFRAIMQLSQRMNFTLVIDEFQEFRNVNSSVFSDMQNIWDSAKDNSKINLILCGSIYSMMKRIFESSKEPLFGRATARMVIKTFDINTIKEILSDYHPNYSNEDLLVFYMITGGVAKYIEQLVSKKAFTKKAILNTLLSEGSFFPDEGHDVLIDEFGKDYGNYFSILSLIASSKTDRGQIESTLNMDIGGYLERLEKEYNIIKRNRPFGAKEGSRSNKYKIEDNFLNFWFRFIYKYRSAVEIGNLDYVRDIVERDYETYSGIILEKYFRTMMIESKEFSDIQGYWNSKGENEIDIVAVNEFEKRLVFCEVKRNPHRISLSELENKAKDIIAKYPKFSTEYKGLSLEDM
ncbi:MAG: ATP-binding protein [Dysgonamonadaceae bacterium]|nr:ATP-binding protein [Dysgonamonadaceae bacterium]